jgi:quercetin dioxygenase-like cupin family protein
MKHSKLTLAAIAAVMAAAAMLWIQPLNAQQPGFTRALLQDVDLSAEGRHGVMATAEFSPGASVGRHTHPGEEMSYVLEGTLELSVDGRPTVTLKAGEFFFIPAGVVHDGKNVGTGKAKVLANYIVKKGEPVSSPAK